VPLRRSSRPSDHFRDLRGLLAGLGSRHDPAAAAGELQAARKSAKASREDGKSAHRVKGAVNEAELESLVRQARDGDPQAQALLIDAYQKRLGGFVYAMVSDPVQVDDLCQTIFIKMILSLRQLREPARFEAWFFRMARNGCLSYLRREKFRRLFSPLSSTHEEVALAAPDAPSRDLLLLRAALKQLPEKHRSLLILVQDRESDYTQIAASFGIGVGALKTRVHRAKLALKERIDYVRKHAME